jgi:ABC-type transport system involved in multi-copper enzyme maturation permease subunit
MNRRLPIWDHPVLNKEFRQRMRIARTPWIIFLYLGIAGTLIFAYMFLIAHPAGVFHPEGSRFLFIGLSIIQLVLLAFVVPGLTAGVISGERERQTLSVLLTMPLSSGGIILSKWIAALAFVILLILSSLPLYASVFLFGGVSPAEILYTIVHLLVTVCFWGALGVFFSTLIRRTGVAMVTTYCTVAMIMVFLPVALYFINQFYERFVDRPPSPSPLVVELLPGLHPVMTQLSVFYGEMAGMDGRIDIYWMYVAVYAVLSAVLLIAASHLLSPVRRKKKSSSPGSPEGDS